MNEAPNYYSIIPASVRYNDDLKANEKLMYGEISSLCNKEGLCYATNAYFARLYRVDNSTISRWISHLKKLGFINLKIEYKEGSMEIVRRVIEINGFPTKFEGDTYIPNNQEGYMPESQEGIDKKIKDNNTSINNNKKKIYKRKIFKPPTLKEVQTYCQERKNNVDPQKFFDYYETSDWHDQNGKPVKNWKQKVITWEGNRASPKNDVLPSWFDKNIQKEEISAEEERELNDLMKEFR